MNGLSLYLILGLVSTLVLTPKVFRNERSDPATVLLVGILVAAGWLPVLVYLAFRGDR